MMAIPDGYNVEIDVEESFMNVESTETQSYMKVQADLDRSYILVNKTSGESYMKVQADLNRSYMLVQADLIKSMILLLPST